MTLKLLSLIALATMFNSAAFAQAPNNPRDWFAAENAEAQLLILGTFHFKDAGLDGYKPEVDIDIMSEERQAELAELHARLAAFAPTKILIEVDYDRNDEFNERYSAYLAGDYELGPNEIYQVGFRLAKRMGHQRLYAVDADGRQYPDLPEDPEAYAEQHGQSAMLKGPWAERYMALYQAEDHAKAGRSLIETLLYTNDPERIRIGHGHYVLRSIGLGDEAEYPGADRISGWWYNRNLRIFANIVRFTEPGDRLLLLIGSGHVPIIRHAADASPEYSLVEVSTYLAR